MSTNPDEKIATSTRLQQLESTLDEFAKYDLPPQVQAAVQSIRLQVNQMAEALEQAQSEAAAARQDKAKFVSVVTHELRLPLTSIKGYTDLLRQGIGGAVNDQQKSFLSIVRTNVDRMSALISDLSDMTYIQTGRLKLQPKSINIASLTEEVIQAWQAKFEEKSQQLSVEIEPGLPVSNIDAARFNQVLGYFLSNANRYTPADGRIVVRACQWEGALRMEVQDNGIGISPEDLERIFTPFFRSDDDAVRQAPGWGLALHVAKLMVEIMGGQIGVSSRLKEGSLFWFSLPL